MLNCKPGDRAVIIKAYFPENLGKVVDVIEACNQRPVAGNLALSRQLWMCESLGSPLRYEVATPAQVNTHQLLQVGPVPDEYLRPLPDSVDTVDAPAEEIEA